MRTTLPLFALLAACQPSPAPEAPASPGPTCAVKPTEDFDVTGSGSNAAWSKAEWHALNRRQPDGAPYESRFKILYSKTGVYILMDGTDSKLMAWKIQTPARLPAMLME